jgi:MYXO-CTERM domain-containing protein
VTRLLGMTLLLLSVAGYSFAVSVSAPEIDASSGVAVLGLLSGGLLVLRGRRRKS